MTALTLENIKTSLPGDVLKDETVPGLSLRVGRRRVYSLYFRTKTGVERRPKIGEHGIISLAQARAEARKMLGEVAAGRDPIAERQVAKKIGSVDEFFALCYENHWKKKRSGGEVKRLYDAYVAPRIGSDRLRDVGYEAVLRIHSALEVTPYQANRALALVSKLLDFAERPGAGRDPGTNPCRHIPRYPELKRKVFCRPDEIGLLGPVLTRYVTERPAEVAFIYVMLFAGPRPTELERITWRQMERVGEGAVGRIPDGKTGQRDVFFPPQAMQAIDRLPRTQSLDALVFGITAGTAAKFWRKVRGEAGVRGELWMRDLRRTFATTALSGGKTRGMVGELLGQKSEQTTMIYAKLIEGAAHTAAAETADTLEEMLTGRSS